MGKLIDKMLDALRSKPPSEASGLPCRKPLSYEQARDLARHDDPEIRGELAKRGDLRPEILYFLVDDPEPEVRRQIAANPATPAQADFRLASDADPSVRGDLAQKIARLAPGLSADDQDRLRRMTYDTLQLLARDQIPRVRQILAEALKDVADAPPEVVRRLAHDTELAVASPVLEFSPVLTDEDLLEIIRSGPVRGALSAISRRRTVGAAVADGIAASADIDAIAVLLANPSAQIREETLDRLLDRAIDHESWHGPLVRRPHLSTRAVTLLTRFVADSLLMILEERTDFDPPTKAAVAAAVRRRVDEAGADMAEFRGGENQIDAITESVRRLYEAGELKEPVILDAIAANKVDFVVVALAFLANIPPARVRKILSMQSAKGTTALGWKAGLSTSCAVLLQTKLAKIATTDALRPLPGSQAYPLTAEDMLWQLELFASMSETAGE